MASFMCANASAGDLNSESVNSDLEEREAQRERQRERKEVSRHR